MSSESQSLLRDFESRQMDNRTFSHREHMMVAWEMLRQYPFTDVVARYGGGIRDLAAAAGAPEKFNTTITIAFLSLVAERMQGRSDDSFAHFAADNPDLMSKDALARYYSPDRLGSASAKLGFLLPDRAA